MKRIYNLENLDCANCAAKMEAKIKKIPGVTAASVSFFAQKLVLEGDESRWNEILSAAQEAIASVDDDCKILVK